MKKHLLLLFAALLPFLVGCQEEGIENQEQQETLEGMREDEVDGIRYLFDFQHNTAVVKGCTESYSEALTIPPTIHYENEDFEVTSIGDQAFYYCNAFTSITIPESVTSIGKRVFFGWNRLTSIVVAEGNKVYDSRGGCNAIIETSSNTLIFGCAETIIPEGVTNIGDEAFLYCTRLKSITILEGVTSISHYAFSNCENLTAITFPESMTIS